MPGTPLCMAWPVYTSHKHGRVHGLCLQLIKTHNPCSWPMFTHAVKRYLVHPHVRPMGPHVRPMGRVYGLCTRFCTQFTHRLRPEYTGSKHGLQHTCFLRPTRVHNPNAISTGSAIFEQLTAQCPYNLQWVAPTPSPLKIVPSMGIWIPSNTWFLETNRVLNPNGILISRDIFAGLTTVTGGQTMLLGQ